MDGRGDGGAGSQGGFTFDTNLAPMHTYLGGMLMPSVHLALVGDLYLDLSLNGGLFSVRSRVFSSFHFVYSKAVTRAVFILKGY